MRKRKLSILAAFLALVLGSCINQDDQGPAKGADYYASFDFKGGIQGWEGGFSDYQSGLEDSLKLAFGYTDFPAGTQFTGKAMAISGQNPQKDLFYFVRNEITNLQPSTTYKLDFVMDFVAELKQAGVPGNGPVYVKVGASATKPDTVVVQNGESTTKQVHFNLDKGPVAEQDGNDMVVLGQLNFDTSDKTQVLTANNSDKAFYAKSDANGNLWVVAGFDSVTDAYLAFYFNRFVVLFTEVK